MPSIIVSAVVVVVLAAVDGAGVLGGWEVLGGILTGAVGLWVFVEIRIQLEKIITGTGTKNKLKIQHARR